MLDRIGELRNIAKRRVNVGCGILPLAGSINVDIANDAADIKADARSLPFPDSSVHWIESHHMLEHLDKAGAVGVIKEFNRVLIPGGLMFLTVPDLPRCFETMLHQIDVPEIWEAMMNSLYGCQNDEHDYHRYGYSMPYLKMIVDKQGFASEVFAWPYRPSPTMGIMARKIS